MKTYTYVERRDELAAGCWQRHDGNYEVEYWDGARCIVPKEEAERNPVYVGVPQGGDD